MNLVYLALAWLAGIALGGWFKLPCLVPALTAVVLLGLLLLWHRQQRARRGLVLGLLLLLGALRWGVARHVPGPQDVDFYAGRPVELRGTVQGEAVDSSYGLSFVLQAEALRPIEGSWQSVRGQVLVQGDRFLEVSYGDRLLLQGELQRPRRGGGRFSYRDHLARQGIHVQLRGIERVTVLETSSGPPWMGVLLDLRAWARRRIEAFIPEPEASLLVGILLGSRTSMPSEIQEAFSRSGTTHILAISGWNISIIAAFFAAAGRRLPRKLSFPLILAGIVLYTFFVGAGAAVLRAALMGVLYVLAQQVGRPSHGITALLASAWAMTLWNPGLLWDIGFQLSLCATLGMLLFVPVWTESLTRWPAFLSESLAATLSSQLLTWPLMALYFRQFSLIVPLSNLLACPTLTPLMLLGALALLLGGVPGLGPVLCGATWLLAAYMLEVVGWAGCLSWASLGLPVLGPLFLLLYYGGMGWWVWRNLKARD